MYSLRPSSKGFTMVELLIALAIGVIIITGTLTALRSAADVASLVGQKAEMQQNARVGLNMVASDLSQAGTGTPSEGIALPGGNKSTKSKRGCDIDGNCYLLTAVYEDQRIYSVTPGDALGPIVNGVPTDVVTLVFKDPTLRLDEYPLTSITPSGSQIRVDSRTDPPITDPSRGVREGDLLILSNTNGAAIGVATSVSDDKILFSNSDSLNFNQPSADHGNIAGLANPGNPKGQFPPTTAIRVNLVTYFLQEAPGQPGRFRLMRQVNARAPDPVAEDIYDLQFTYDLFNDADSTSSTGLSNGGGFPNQIRKVNVALSARSPRKTTAGEVQFQFVTLRTSVSGRNLTFRDRFE